MHPLVRISNFGLGLVLQTGFRIDYTPQTMRRNFRFLTEVSPTKLKQRYPTLKVESLKINGVECESLTPAEGYTNTLIYLHGGGYFMGSPAEYRLFTANMAHRLKMRVILVNYRLAPEFPHPAPLDDSLAVYQELLKSVAAETLIIGGDSAGGGLTLSTLLALRDRNLPLPKKAFLISPWVDRSGSSNSLERNKNKDVWLSPAHIETWAAWSLAGQNPRDPYISPLFGDYRGFPPLLVSIGDQEVLFDEACEVVRKASTAGVTADLIIGKDMQHDWFISLPWLPESRRAKRKLLEFLAQS